MSGNVDFADLVNPLRIVFIADTHNEHYSLMKRAVALACEDGPIDYLFHLGDFLHNFKGRPGVRDEPYVPYATAARRLDEIADEFGLKGYKVIPGNHEVKHPEKGLCELEKSSIHGKVINLEGYNFLGYGGGFNFAQAQGWDFFNDARYRCDSEELGVLLEENDVDVLLLHQLETKSRDKSLRGVIEDSNVSMVISGHTHSHGYDFYGNPMYASCGPIWPLDERSHQFKNMGKSSYAVLEIDGKVARMRFYFFNKDRKSNGDKSQLATGLKVNFECY